jgi:hypothetical protein
VLPVLILESQPGEETTHMRSPFIVFSWFALFALIFVPGGIVSSQKNDIPYSPDQIVNQNIPIHEFQEGTPVPEITDEASDPEYPQARNPGLVFGAIILVLIIIGGVIINSRFFKKK